MEHTILTITLNPAVDKSSAVDRIVPERKLRCSSPVYEPGGGGINASRALKRLGLDAQTFFLSGGRTGALLEHLLSEEWLGTVPFAVRGETRENLIVVDSSNGQQYRFGMPGDTVSATEQGDVLQRLQKISPLPGLVVVSGSLPPGVPPAFLRKLIVGFKSRGSKVIVDTSGEALRESATEGVFLLKPNLGELAALSGRDELDSSSAEAAATDIIEAGKAEVVVVSLGAQGAFLASSSERVWLPAPVVKVRSTVGAGDSMVAGMVSVLAQGGSYREMLRMGVACGSATTMAEGTGLFRKDDVDRLLAEIADK